jgi:hypothetical protein
MPLTEEGRRLRARAAAVTRHHPDQPELVADTRRQLKADAAERYVRQLVDHWPPLTDTQRGRLAALLAGSDPAEGAATVPGDERSRRGQPAARRAPRDTIAEGTTRILDRWDVAGELLAAAAAYQQAGWSIVPAAIEGKRALVSWKQWQRVAAGPEQLANWARRYPRANWAVVTGRVSGVVAVDVDPDAGGNRALAELERRHGDLPWSAVVETPSGGAHVYLTHPGGRVRNSASRIGLGVDVRGDGGLALLPPSRRPGGAYRWAVGGPGSVPLMPAAWVELLRPPPRPAVAATRTTPGAGQDPEGDGHNTARLAGILRALQRTPIGQRNNCLYWCGRRLAELVDQGAPADWRHTLAAAARHCGLDPAEVEDTLDSALRAER